MTNDQKKTIEKISKYYRFLCELHYKILEEDCVIQKEMITKHKLSGSVFSVLINKGIITKERQNYFHWVTSVNPSKQMAAAVYSEVCKEESLKTNKYKKPKTNKIRPSQNEVKKRYFEFLSSVYEKCSKDEYFSLSRLIIEFRCSDHTSRVIKDLGIITPIDKKHLTFRYKWNKEKPSEELAVSVHKSVKSFRRNNIDNNKASSTKNKESLSLSQKKTLQFLKAVHKECLKGEAFSLTDIISEVNCPDSAVWAIKDLGIIKLTGKTGYKFMYKWDSDKPCESLAVELNKSINERHKTYRKKSNPKSSTKKTPKSEKPKDKEPRPVIKPKHLKKQKEEYIINFLWGLFSIRKAIKQ